MSTPLIRYTPGSWLGVTTARLSALVAISIDDPRVSRIWEAAADGIDEVLDVLVRDGLRTLPGFAMLEWTDGGTRCLLRGPLMVRVGDDDDLSSLDGSAAGVWLDTMLAADTRRVHLAAPDSAIRPTLPTSGGLIPAGTLTVLLGDPMPAAGEGAATTAPLEELPSEPQSEVTPGPDPESEAHPEPGPDDALTAAADRTALYEQLLSSSTSDLDAVRERWASSEAVPDPSAAVAQPEEPDRSARLGATGVWRDESHELSDGVPTPPSPEPEPEQSSGPEPESGIGVIDGLPWAAPLASDPSPATPAPREKTSAFPTPPARPTPPVAGGAPEPAALATGAPGATTPAASPDGVDAMAVTTSRAALLRQLAEEHLSGPTVLAVSCHRGHVSPPYAVICRSCGAQLPEQTPVEIPRPALGRLVLSTGTTVLLDKGVIFGRAPHSDIDDAAARPNLVRLVESGEISRMHTSITLEGWQVLVRDLGSQNGTYMTMPGGEPQQLRSHEDYQLEPGTVVSLADVVTFSYEVGQ